MVAHDPMEGQCLQRLDSLRTNPQAFAVANLNPYGMEPSFTRRLQTEAVNQYRHNYRFFRKGKAQGAKGESPVALCPEDEQLTPMRVSTSLELCMLTTSW